LIKKAGERSKQIASNFRNGVSELQGNGPIVRLKKRFRSFNARAFDALAEHEEEEAESVLRMLDHFIWSDTVQNTLTRCEQISETFEQDTLSDAFRKMKIRSAEDVYVENFQEGPEVYPPLAMLVDKALLVSERIVEHGIVPLSVNFALIGDYDPKTDKVKTEIDKDKTKKNVESLLEITRLAHLFLGLDVRLDQMPEFSEDGKVNGGKFLHQKFVVKIGENPIFASFLYKSPQVKAIRKKGKLFRLEMTPLAFAVRLSID